MGDVPPVSPSHACLQPPFSARVPLFLLLHLFKETGEFPPCVRGARGAGEGSAGVRTGVVLKLEIGVWETKISDMPSLPVFGSWVVKFL